MLGEVQWAWLQNELTKSAPITVIGSGIQVLPPTYRQWSSMSEFCAYGDGEDFENANRALNEGPEDNTESFQYEMWAEIPQSRLRLLQMCQEAINAGYTKRIIFISGDPHWAEVMAKKMPARDGQAETWLYEVTASGIDQYWGGSYPNTNRVSSTNIGPDAISTFTAGGSGTCSGSDWHLCTATSNYGMCEPSGCLCRS